MLRALTTLVAGLFLAGSALAGPQLNLKKDQVQIVDGKMVIKELDRCNVLVSGKVAESFHVKRYAEAPVNGELSRDYFVQIVGIVEASLVQSFTEAVKEGGSLPPGSLVECAEVPPGTAEPMATVRVVFDDKGMRITGDVQGEGQVANEFMTWDQLRQG